MAHGAIDGCEKLGYQSEDMGGEMVGGDSRRGRAAIEMGITEREGEKYGDSIPK